MKTIFSFSVMIALFLNSCGSTAPKKPTYHPVRKPTPVIPAVSNTGSSTTPAAQTEREYQALVKTYKSETAAVLTDILNGSSDPGKTSVTIENKSRCNIVLTVSGTNYFKKIPIGVNKKAAVMVPKNQNYNFSGMICGVVYQKAKLVTGAYSLALSNQVN
ncbi:competence protein ComL [Chryseobacterium sp. SSA4.19]|uniref:DUF6759 domain-containing protein n=1 Tax=Chryseobacterium sp. SSA4.19 TaxID=2919915 RepID=UPI001F4E683F|nr:DUF6759 domain-containing protein [Chryseobacterium sp. SSA4.19]MCJ8153638.1 competence protein ComL [Chryseobacterium sp. SSA4.19]